MSMLLLAQQGGLPPSTGAVIIVVVSLAVLGIVGFFFVCYFAHCFLTVVVDSAAGIDEVRWPSESVTDWITKPIYVLWVLLPLVIVPFVVLLATGSGRSFCIALVVSLWAVAPVMFLSSLAAKSWIALFYGPFLKRWARFFHAYVIFLAWSSLLNGLGAALMVWALWDLRGVALAAIFLPPLFLLYWRVFGRYAWYVTTRRMQGAKRRAVNPVKGLKVKSLDPWAPPSGEMTEPEPGPSATDDDSDAVDVGTAPDDLRDKVMSADAREKFAAVDDPYNLAPQEDQATGEEDEWTPNKKPYGVMTDVAAKQSWVERRGAESQDADGYDVERMDIGPPVSLWQYYSDRAKKEDELREQGKSVRQFERPRKPPTLRQAMTQEIAGFVFYSHCLRTWLNLGLLFGIILGMLNLIVSVAASFVG